MQMVDVKYISRAPRPPLTTRLSTQALLSKITGSEAVIKTALGSGQGSGARARETGEAGTRTGSGGYFTVYYHTRDTLCVYTLCIL
jgi:hypothetical protein